MSSLLELQDHLGSVTIGTKFQIILNIISKVKREKYGETEMGDFFYLSLLPWQEIQVMGNYR